MSKRAQELTEAVLAGRGAAEALAGLLDEEQSSADVLTELDEAVCEGVSRGDDGDLLLEMRDRAGNETTIRLHASGVWTVE